MYKRSNTRKVNVGGVQIGGQNKVVIQSMCNTKTKDIEKTVEQIKKLEKLGCEIIRVACLDVEDAKAIKEIKKQINIPIVADILAEMGADSDTVCAGLLHDTIEDTDVTKKQIREEFNSVVANLVDGVTKYDKQKFKGNAKQRKNADTRKIVKGLTEDVRIIIIKLADRLHNMRTLQYHKPEKQIEIAQETLDIFVPLAQQIGAYRIQAELEDIACMYLHPKEFKEITAELEKRKKDNLPYVEQMKQDIEETLKSNGLDCEIDITTKNIYSIYKRIYEYKEPQRQTYTDIHDLIGLRIKVPEEIDCFTTLYYINKKYRQQPGSFKDYINNPKDNLYQSLHTTVWAPNGRLVQARIRTYEMDKIASHGLTAYWDIHGKSAREEMQREIEDNSLVYDILDSIENETYADDKEYVDRVMKELFCKRVYVKDARGESVWLPAGSTVKDYAKRTEEDFDTKVFKYEVNGHSVNKGYKLQENDSVKVICIKDKVSTSEIVKEGLKEFKKVILMSNMYEVKEDQRKEKTKTLVKENSKSHV